MSERAFEIRVFFANARGAELFLARAAINLGFVTQMVEMTAYAVRGKK